MKTYVEVQSTRKTSNKGIIRVRFLSQSSLQMFSREDFTEIQTEEFTRIKWVTILTKELANLCSLEKKIGQISSLILSHEKKAYWDSRLEFLSMCFLISSSNSKSLSTRLTDIRYIGHSLSSIASWKVSSLDLINDKPIRTSLESFVVAQPR